MLQKFKITAYAITVALAAVLVLTVNAAELQLVIHKGKLHKELPSFKKKQSAKIQARRAEADRLQTEKDDRCVEEFMRDMASEVSEGSALMVIARSLIQRLQHEGQDSHLINEGARITGCLLQWVT